MSLLVLVNLVLETELQLTSTPHISYNSLFALNMERGP